MKFHISVGIAILSALCSAAGAQTLRFNRDVRPILAENCFPCHGPDARARKANLRLDLRDAAIARKAVFPGNAAKSRLVERIRAKSPALLMPPAASHKKLTAAEKDKLAAWIDAGARYEEHWSYLPVSRPAVPNVQSQDSRVRNPIDAFIRAKLIQRGLKPSAEADRRTLIRRVYLDLIGIPPGPGEVSAFLTDKSPRAYEDVADRLLASPQYGERMAIPWLDVVRYADTVGFHGDQNQNSWAYRDYVVKSFNDDKPFDRFTTEQIAGDLLPKPTPETLTATCFNRLNMVTREGGAQPKEYMAKYAADRVRTVGMAWLGSTFGCAECHDHKYDPITQRDFYSMAAFFADLKQWGVYADYAYTPEPELRGIGNDHPFPPEIKVESTYLKQRIQRNRRRIRTIAVDSGFGFEADAAVKAAYRSWRTELRDFLAKNPGGWAPLNPDSVISGANTADSRSYGQPQADGSVLIADNAPADVKMIASSSGWAASVRVELLPAAAYEGSVLRKGSGTLLRVALGAVNGSGQERNLAIRHASANFAIPRFQNSFEVIGIHSGWTLDAGRMKQPLTSVWILVEPVRLADGERLTVSLKGAKPGCVRVSVSPLVPADPDSLEIDAENLEQLKKTDETVTELALEAYLRGTGWHALHFGRLKKMEADILACRSGVTPVMVSESVKPIAMRVLPRGNWQDESGPIVEPAVPHFLPQSQVPKGRRLTRLDLANWLVSPENPLTSRMFVNRLWKQFFGAALSDKVEDLGTQGEWPTHPELLDWLAAEFMKPTDPTTHRPNAPAPWSIKRIVRFIVTSETYRQSSAPHPAAVKVDPQNRLLASQNARRLEAELVRDNALAIAGMLNWDVGGPPVKPYQPADYYINLQFPDRDYVADADDRQYRRGVYMHWQRTFLHPMLANFDAPSREDCIAARATANTPQQALTLLNDPEFVEAARGFAARLLRESNSDSGRLDVAFQLALTRPIKAPERASLLRFLSRVREEYRTRPEDARKLLAVGYSPKPSGDEIELAVWTSVCRVILNLHEVITRY